MIIRRPAAERGRSRTAWLDSRHGFSFGDYYDPAHMGISVLRVLNDDRVAPAAGFGGHGHRDMEIITCVIEGALMHKDSLGNGSVIRPGEVQRMSAGSGIVHSEYNASDSEPVRFLQIWIIPAHRGEAPSYEQRAFAPSEMEGRLRVVASPDGEDDAVHLDQDARLSITRLSANGELRHALPPGRRTYVFVATGGVTLNDTDMAEGDAATIEQEPALVLRSREASEVLLFDLP